LLVAAAGLELVLQVARPAVLDRVRERAFPVSDGGFVTLQPINFDPQSGLPLLVYDPEAFWVMAPDRRGAFFLTSDVRTNALGLRGPDVPPRSGDAELRLLFLGDSVTFGMRVAEAERYSDQLVARLRAEQPERNVTAVNAGIIGYAATQVRARLPAWLDAVQPDVVCLAVGLNDCIRLPASDAEFRGLTTSWWERVRHGVRRSQLVCAAEAGWAGLRRQAGALTSQRRSVAEWLHYPSLPAGGPHVPRTSEPEFFARLDEIAALCRDRGAALVLLTEYVSDQVPSERLRDQGLFERLEHLSASLRDWARRHELPVADARLALERSGRPPQELLLDFCHPSPAGHALIAEELHRVLAEAGLLPSRRAGGEER
jgi:lysophospholipase L1-like esterase